jgi:hypothetical protein
MYPNDSANIVTVNVLNLAIRTMPPAAAKRLKQGRSIG